jgi:hypothetical protein
LLTLSTIYFRYFTRSTDKTCTKFNSLYMLETFIPVKAIPLYAWKGREGSRRLRLPDCRTFDT